MRAPIALLAGLALGALSAGTAAAADARPLSPETIKATMEAYVAAVNAKDPAAITALYDDDATVEDPAGSTPRRGRQAILKFYQDVAPVSRRLDIVAINPAKDDSGAMFFQIRMDKTTIDVIETMTFNDAAKITAMRAYVAFVPVAK